MLYVTASFARMTGGSTISPLSVLHHSLMSTLIRGLSVPPFGQQVVVSMKKHLIINTTIFCWVIVAEVLVINASSKAQNQPLSLDVVEAVSSVVFVINYFHVPLPLAIFLAVVVVLLPAWLVMVLARRFFGLIR